MQVVHRLARMMPEQPDSKSNLKSTFDVDDREEEKYDDKSGWTYAEYEGNHGAPAQLVTRKDAPAYLKRPYVFTGYLVGGCPKEATMKTLTSLNNETLNAWTMIVAAALACMYYDLSRVWFYDDSLPFKLFLVSCLLHTPFSVRLHCTIGVSEASRDLWRTVDVFFIFTCSVPRAASMAWYVFTSATAFWTYLALVAGVWAYCVASTMLLRRIKDIPKKSLTTAVGTSVFAYTLPALAAALMEIREGRPGAATVLYLAMAAAMTFASGSYALRWPECCWPGRFDLIGSSHQMMHVGVIIAYGLEWLFIVRMAERQGATSSYLTNSNPWSSAAFHDAWFSALKGLISSEEGL